MADHTPVMMYGLPPELPLEPRRQAVDMERIMQEMLLHPEKAQLNALRDAVLEVVKGQGLVKGQIDNLDARIAIALKRLESRLAYEIMKLEKRLAKKPRRKRKPARHSNGSLRRLR